MTRMGKRHHIETILERIDPRGGKYYSIGGDDLGFAAEDGSDCRATHKGYVSVTPLQVDLTNYKISQNSSLPNYLPELSIRCWQIKNSTAG